MDLRLHFWLCFAAGLGVSSSTDDAPTTDQPHRHVLEKLRTASHALPATGFPSATPSAQTLPPPATAPPSSIWEDSTLLFLQEEVTAEEWEPSRPSATKSCDNPSVPGAGQETVRGAGDCREPGHESRQLQELIPVVRGLRADLHAICHIQEDERRHLGAIAGSLAELAGAVRQMVRELPSLLLRGHSQLPPPAPCGQDPESSTGPESSTESFA